jgi:hypothetical protein
MATFYKKILRLPSLDLVCKLNIHRKRQRYLQKILLPWAIFNYQYEDDARFKDILKMLKMPSKSHNFQILIVSNFNPIHWAFKVYKFVKTSNQMLRLQSQKYTIKKYKNQILQTLSRELSLATAPWEKANYDHQTLLNQKLMDDKKTHYIGSKRQWSNEVKETTRLNNISIKNLQKKIHPVTGQSLSAIKITLLFKSYDTLIGQQQFINNPWVAFFNFFSMTIQGENNSSLMAMGPRQWQWNLTLSINNVPGFINDFTVHHHKTWWKRVVAKRRLMVAKNKDILRKNHHTQKTHRFQQVKKYRKNAMDILTKYNNYFVAKYKNNIYNNRYYYEFLMTKNNYTVGFLRFNYNFIEYLWKTALKNPLSWFHC